ncbi:siderophore-interacting protein [Enterovirga aerilata]|uniref:Siderophore-interacting protein n=1 Tax=Enterovirga aerilata TaxID=2730920 RepID=A0A849I9R8_9HYPH|nr:siderophore-interacting protein [Enterovirga sp. DB1703]NNM72747.1 siderophore-interacting protein [Enterovirga sp. DB1703]
MNDLSPTNPARHRIERVRHELKRRVLTVAKVERLVPSMVRVTLAGPDLAGFVSASYDDHVKLFFPVEGGEPAGRDYTPRRFDPARNELAIDFALHEAGPATRWASEARQGDSLTIGGPRGSFVVPDDFDWYLFVGDETALPAIGRRLEELRPGTRSIVVAEVAGPQEELALPSRSAVEAIWVHRGAAEPGTTTGLEEAVARLSLPEGEGYAWVAGEAAIARRLRRLLVEQHGQPKEWLKAAAYWTRGRADAHGAIED